MVKTSIEEYRQRAARGDAEALFELAWSHFRGDLVPKDFQTAIALLRQMEEKSPQLARFNIAKMKYLGGDASFQNDIRVDCDAGFGPALYLMGIYLKKEGTISAQVKQFLTFEGLQKLVTYRPRFFSGDTLASAWGDASRLRSPPI
jgi:TPR repeat protein